MRPSPRPCSRDRCLLLPWARPLRLAHRPLRPPATARRPLHRPRAHPARPAPGFTASAQPSMIVFAVVYGLVDVATVPRSSPCASGPTATTAPSSSAGPTPRTNWAPEPLRSSAPPPGTSSAPTTRCGSPSARSAWSPLCWPWWSARRTATAGSRRRAELPAPPRHPPRRRGRVAGSPGPVPGAVPQAPVAVLQHAGSAGSRAGRPDEHGSRLWRLVGISSRDTGGNHWEINRRYQRGIPTSCFL